MNNNYIIRDANVSDLDRIIELYKQLYETEYYFEHQICNSLKEPNEYFSCKGFKKEITYRRKQIKDQKVKFIVCVYENKIVGYASAYIKNHPAYTSKILFGDEIVIDKDYRKHGIGNSLINEIINWGKKKKAKMMVLTAFENNKPSMDKHLHLGFVKRHICLIKEI